jgi:hypothetical protein
MVGRGQNLRKWESQGKAASVRVDRLRSELMT